MSSNYSPCAPLVATSNEQRRKNEIKMQTAQINSYAWPCCLNCEQWDKTKEVCQKYDMRPPAPVIAVGCEEYTPDIPF